jgi:signal-transduction protein with cAMP-binding, CBS, and nucleotidyltransferase domain
MMARHQVRRLPVVEGDKLVGIVSLCDLVHNHRLEMEAAWALSEISENILRG